MTNSRITTENKFETIFTNNNKKSYVFLMRESYMKKLDLFDVIHNITNIFLNFKSQIREYKLIYYKVRN